MPKYSGFNPEETCLYIGRRNRQSFDICYRATGDDYSLEDKAGLLYQVISEADKNMNHAFTPIVATKFLKQSK